MGDLDSPAAIIATSQLLAEHRSEASRLQRAMERLTALVAHPYFALCVGAAVGCWIGGNSLAFYLKMRPADEPPFFWLQGAVSLLGLLIALLLISTQRREGMLADRRAHLILEMVIQSELKSAKAIQLLEEARRDNPLLRNRNDSEAETLSVPTDHVTVLGAIRGEEP